MFLEVSQQVSTQWINFATDNAQSHDSFSRLAFSSFTVPQKIILQTHCKPKPQAPERFKRQVHLLHANSSLKTACEIALTNVDFCKYTGCLNYLGSDSTRLLQSYEEHAPLFADAPDQYEPKPQKVTMAK